MSVSRIGYSKQAFRHIELAHEWWHKNRPKAPWLLRDEFAASIRVIRDFPDVGIPYRHRKIPGMRKYVLLESNYILYYIHLPVSHEVIILALWSGDRGRNPPIRQA